MTTAETREEEEEDDRLEVVLEDRGQSGEEILHQLSQGVDSDGARKVWQEFSQQPRLGRKSDLLELPGQLPHQSPYSGQE